MPRTVPPLNPLRVFETVARLTNFTKAAEELHVSQSAVSRQVSLLEDYLGVKLFNREQHGVTLTEAGRNYQQDIGPAFARIAAATQRLLQNTRGGEIVVRAYTTFAAKWLLRRLPQFQSAYPEIHVRLSTDVTPVNFDIEHVDLAIQFGDGSWPGAVSERLFGDDITPMCSPSLLKSGIPLTKPEDLVQHRLLRSRYRKSDWQDWLSAVGSPDVIDQAESMEFPSSILTYQAAIDGLGIAIGQIRLLENELESGVLVCPFRQVMQRRFAYYLLLPERTPISKKVQTFRDWLIGEIRNLPPVENYVKDIQSV
jgi:LysR family glycine cleavage system transcriptional activator